MYIQYKWSPGHYQISQIEDALTGASSQILNCLDKNGAITGWPKF